MIPRPRVRLKTFRGFPMDDLGGLSYTRRLELRRKATIACVFQNIAERAKWEWALVRLERDAIQKVRHSIMRLKAAQRRRQRRGGKDPAQELREFADIVGDAVKHRTRRRSK